MTGTEEYRLYHADRPAWAEYVAPNWARMLSERAGEAKRALWELAGAELRAAVTALKS